MGEVLTTAAQVEALVALDHAPDVGIGRTAIVELVQKAKVSEERLQVIGSSRSQLLTFILNQGSCCQGHDDCMHGYEEASNGSNCRACWLAFSERSLARRDT